MSFVSIRHKQCRNRVEWLCSIRTFVLFGFWFVFFFNFQVFRWTICIYILFSMSSCGSFLNCACSFLTTPVACSLWVDYWVCPHGLFAAPWLVSVKGRERKMRIWEWDYPRVLSRCSVEPKKRVPDSRELVVAGLAKCLLAPFSVTWHKALPTVFPIELVGLGRAGWHLDFPITLCSVWMCWEPLGYRDKVVVVQYYFSLCLHALGTSSFICVLVLRKVRTQTAQMEQCSIYLLLFPIFPKPGLRELELMLTQGSVVL